MDKPQTDKITIFIVGRTVSLPFSASGQKLRKFCKIFEKTDRL